MACEHHHCLLFTCPCWQSRGAIGSIISGISGASPRSLLPDSHSSRFCLAGSEAVHDARRCAHRIAGASVGANSDVVHLWPKRQMLRNPELNSAASAECECVRRTRSAACACCKVRSAEQNLRKRSNPVGLPICKSRPDQIGVGIGTDSKGRSVIHTKVAGDSQPAVGVTGQRNRTAIGVDTVAQSFTEIGITNGQIGGSWLLSTNCCGRETENPKSQKHEFAHDENSSENSGKSGPVSERYGRVKTTGKRQGTSGRG